MGILVRLFLSLGGMIVGAAAFAAAGGALSCVIFSLPYFAYVEFSGAEELWNSEKGNAAQNYLMLMTCVGVLGAVPSGIRGAIFGYKTGLKMGRDICFAPEPEQNSRVEVTVNGKSKKG